MTNPTQEISDELHTTADMLASVRATMLKYHLLSKGKSYDRHVTALINKLSGEGNRHLLEMARSMR